MRFPEGPLGTAEELRQVALEQVKLRLGARIGGNELHHVRVLAELDGFCDELVVRLEMILAGRQAYREVQGSVGIPEGPLVQLHLWCRRILTCGHRWLPRWLEERLRRRFLKHVRYRHQEIATQHVRCCPHDLLAPRAEHLRWLLSIPAGVADLDRQEAQEKLVARVLAMGRQLASPGTEAILDPYRTQSDLLHAVRDYEEAMRGSVETQFGGRGDE